MKRILIICLFLLNPITSYAKDTKTILIYSKDMQQLFILKSVNDTDIELRTIDKSTYIKPACASSTLVSIDSLLSSKACLIDSIEQNFSLTIDNYINLNLEAIDEDYTLTYRATDLHSFDDVQTYFEELGATINFSVIWRFYEYMDTDLDIKELFDFYDLYASESLTTTYYYPFLIQINSHWIPLDKSFYLKQG